MQHATPTAQHPSAPSDPSVSSVSHTLRQPDGYRDVHNACHAYLMRHDAAYARGYAYNQERSTRVQANRQS